MRKLLVLLSAVALIVAFTVPAMAADWGFYGSSRMTTFNTTLSKEVTGTDFDDADWAWTQQSNSRIGANVKAGAIGGKFEYGTGINLRQLFGTWNFGAGTLLIGQTYTPVFYLVSNQVWGSDNDLVTFGGVYSGRLPMIQLKMGGLKIALVRPNTPGGTVPGHTDIDTTMPKLEVCYSFKAGPVSLKPMLGINSYDETDPLTDESCTIDSAVIGLGFNVGLGAAYVKGSIYSGTNLGQYGFLENPTNDAAYDATSDSIKDSTSMGYQLVAGFKASDMITVEAGYGAVETELDMTGTYEDDVSCYYVNAVITLAKGFFIVPEIGKVDYGERQWGTTTKTKQGDTSYFGAKWQINF